jgi:hypothetical protein
MVDTLDDTRVETNPRLVELPSQKMAVVYTRGNPAKTIQVVLPVLYSAVYKLRNALAREGKDFAVGPLCARWPNAHLVSKDQWIGIWGLPVPADTVSLPQKQRQVKVEIETWTYGQVAQIFYVGPYSSEGPSVKRLHEFISHAGCEIAGPHEEVYLARPGAPVQRTIIRYVVCEHGTGTDLGPHHHHDLVVVHHGHEEIVEIDEIDN